MDKNIIKGVLIPGSECSNILSEVIRHVQSEKIFPQKYLYATLRGAHLWRWLASPQSGSTIAKVYEESPFRNSQSEVLKAVTSAAKQAVKDSARGGESILGIMVLGCGDGKREAELCGRFLDEKVADKLRVVLVDVSSELIEGAVKKFETWIGRCEVSFAVLDFENMAALQELRRRYFFGMPVMALLLGNTLGNVDEGQMLSEIVGALEPNDYLLAEMLLCNEEDTKTSSEPKQIGDDTRFEFITTPLLLLGIKPKRANLYCIVAGNGKGKKIQTFQYRFNEISEGGDITVEDIAMASIHKVHLKHKSSIDLLEIKAVTQAVLRGIGKDAGLSDPEVFEHLYQTPDRKPLSMGYLLGRVRQTV